MPNRPEIPGLTPEDAHFAVLVAMTVRNAIATALHARRNFLHRSAREYLGFQQLLVPDYWEAPELLDEYVESWRRSAAQHSERDEQCARCGRTILDIGAARATRWTHLSADGGTNVGCRAASFRPGIGWDDSLDRRWKARPMHRHGSPGATA